MDDRTYGYLITDMAEVIYGPLVPKNGRRYIERNGTCRLAIPNVNFFMTRKEAVDQLGRKVESLMDDLKFKLLQLQEFDIETAITEAEIAAAHTS